MTGQVYAELRGLRIGKVRRAALVDLRFVGENKHFGAVRCFEALARPVVFLVLLLAAHAQRERGDLFEVPFARKEQVDRIILHRFLLRRFGYIRGIGDDAAARRGVFLHHLLQLRDDDRAELAAACQRILQLGDLAFELVGLLGALEDVFAVDVAQLDLGDILGLHLVDTEADHKIRHNIALALGAADDGDGAVDIEQDLFQSVEKMEFFLLLRYVKVYPPPHAFQPPGDPFVQNFADTAYARRAAEQNVEVAGEAVLQRRHAEELLHELFGIDVALNVNGELETVEVGLVAHIADLAELAGLDELGDLIDDRLYGRAVRDLVDLNDALLGVKAPAGTDLHAAAAGLIERFHLAGIADDLAAGREIRRGERCQNIMFRVLQQRDRRFAHLAEVEPTDIRRHADGDAHVCRDEHIRERGRKERRLRGGVIVVRDKVHGVLVDIAEELRTDGRKLCLRIARGRPRHVARVHLAEVALGIDERREQRPIAPGKTYHRVVDGGVAVGVIVHRRADDVRRFRARAGKKAHFIHAVQQLSVARLEAVDLRNGTRDDNAHRIGHIIVFERFGDGLLHNGGAQPHYVLFLGRRVARRRVILLSCHICFLIRSNKVYIILLT